MPALHGVSRGSLRDARTRLDDLARSGAGDLALLGDELFGVVRLLDDEGPVRRALSDPARDGRARAGLAQALLGERVSPGTVELLTALVREPWSSSSDLVDAVETLAVEAVVAQAQRLGHLDDVEDELFRFSRVVASQPRLRAALADRALPAERKFALIESLLGGRTTNETRRLVRQVATGSRGRTVERMLEDYGSVAAERRNRLVARVTAATELTAEQQQRLATALRSIYGHDMQLAIDIDPGVVGGLRVVVGDEEVDGTLSTRLDEARRRLAG